MSTSNEVFLAAAAWRQQDELDDARREIALLKDIVATVERQNHELAELVRHQTEQIGELRWKLVDGQKEFA